MKISIILYFALILALARRVESENLKVRIDGQRLILYSKSFCGSKKINPKTDFNFQVKFKGQYSTPVHFSSIKDSKISPILFPKDQSEIFSNFSIKVYKDTPTDFDVIILQDGGNDDSLQGCDKEYLPHILPSKEITQPVLKIL